MHGFPLRAMSLSAPLNMSLHAYPAGLHVDPAHQTPEESHKIEWRVENTMHFPRLCVFHIFEAFPETSCVSFGVYYNA